MRRQFSIWLERQSVGVRVNQLCVSLVFVDSLDTRARHVERLAERR
jgi:hypothetical protein